MSKSFAFLAQVGRALIALHRFNAIFNFPESQCRTGACHVAQRVSRCWRYITLVRALRGRERVPVISISRWCARLRPRVRCASRFVVKTTDAPYKLPSRVLTKRARRYAQRQKRRAINIARMAPRDRRRCSRRVYARTFSQRGLIARNTPIKMASVQSAD